MGVAQRVQIAGFGGFTSAGFAVAVALGGEGILNVGLLLLGETPVTEL